MAPSSTTICAIYVTGLIMTSNDYYQGNISCAITGLHQYSIYVSVAPDTLINRFTAYILAVDTTELAVASKYFVDYGVMRDS